MYRSLFYLFYLFALVGEAQDNKYDKFLESGKTRITYPQNIYIHQIDIKQYLNQYIPNLKNTKLVLNYNEKNEFGRQIQFNQVFSEVKIYGATIRIIITPKGKLFSIADNTINITDKTHILKDSPVLPIQNTSETTYKIWLYTHNVLELGQMQISKSGTKKIYNSKGQLVRDEKQKAYNKNITLNVFNPDPITSAGVTYGERGYKDNGDANNDDLNSQLVEVKSRGTLKSDGFYYLENEYFKIVDVQPPNIEPTKSKTGQFLFNRSDDAFEQANAFYHLTTLKDYLVNTLHVQTPKYQISVDANGEYGQDMSSYSYSERLLAFGTGGIDDAEDADNIAHELFHSLAFELAKNTRMGIERKCIEEAFCDYFAVSYSRSINDYNWTKIFNWDGNSSWSGRKATSDKKYPDLKFNSIYTNTDFWCSIFVDIYDKLGRNYTDKLAIKSLMGLSNNMNMKQMAEYTLKIIAEDKDMGKRDIVHKIFSKYGIDIKIPGLSLSVNYKRMNNGIKLKNLSDFTQGGILTIELPDSGEKKINIYNMNAVNIESIFTLDKEIYLMGNNYPSGIYIIKIEINEQLFTRKIIKY